MEELKHKIAVAAGITDEQAQKAIDVIREDLKGKAPKAFHQEIDNVLNGAKFGDSFREKAEDVRVKVEEAARQAGSKAEVLISEVKEKINELFNSGKGTTGNSK